METEKQRRREGELKHSMDGRGVTEHTAQTRNHAAPQTCSLWLESVFMLQLIWTNRPSMSPPYLHRVQISCFGCLKKSVVHIRVPRGNIFYTFIKEKEISFWVNYNIKHQTRGCSNYRSEFAAQPHCPSEQRWNPAGTRWQDQPHSLAATCRSGCAQPELLCGGLSGQGCPRHSPADRQTNISTPVISHTRQITAAETLAPCFCSTSRMSLWALSAATCRGVMKLKEMRGSGKALIGALTPLFISLMQKIQHMDLLLVLIVNVGTFAQQQLSHLLPLGMGWCHSTVLQHSSHFRDQNMKIPINIRVSKNPLQRYEQRLLLLKIPIWSTWYV